MCELLLDTDVLIKLAAYRLLAEVSHAGCDSGCTRRTGVVAAASFVARKRLSKKAADPEAAAARLAAFLSDAAIIEPTEDELAMAAEFEDAANRAGVDLDIGESQLCAIALTRGQPIVLTGDKRAVLAIERLLPKLGSLGAVAGRIACLEQALTLAVDRLGALVVRAFVLAERAADRAVSICFEVTREAARDDFRADGLLSYIDALRRDAPSVLQPGYRLDVSAVP